MKTKSKGIKPPIKLNHFSFIQCLNYSSPTEKDNNIPFDWSPIWNTQLFRKSDSVVSSKSRTCTWRWAPHRCLCWFTTRGKFMS